MRILIALVFVASCSKSEKKPEGAPAVSPCEAAVSNGVDKTIAKRRAGNAQPMTPQEQEVPKKLKIAFAKSCVDDKWSAEVIDCFTTADDIATCKDKLTPEQRTAYSRAAMGVMAGAGGGGMPAHGTGGGMGGGMGGSGSAMGGSGDPPPTPPAPPTPPTPPAGTGSN